MQLGGPVKEGRATENVSPAASAMAGRTESVMDEPLTGACDARSEAEGAFRAWSAAMVSGKAWGFMVYPTAEMLVALGMVMLVVLTCVWKLGVRA